MASLMLTELQSQTEGQEVKAQKLVDVGNTLRTRTKVDAMTLVREKQPRKDVRKAVSLVLS